MFLCGNFSPPSYCFAYALTYCLFIFTQVYGYNLLCLYQRGLHFPKHSVCPRTMLSQWGSAQLHAPRDLPRHPWAEDKSEDTHTHKNEPARTLQNQEEARFQGHEKKAWMENGILSHVSTFGSPSWQALFWPLMHLEFVSENLSNGDWFRGWAHESPKGKKD